MPVIKWRQERVAAAVCAVLVLRCSGGAEPAPASGPDSRATADTQDVSGADGLDVPDTTEPDPDVAPDPTDDGPEPDSGPTFCRSEEVCPGVVCAACSGPLTCGGAVCASGFPFASCLLACEEEGAPCAAGFVCALREHAGGAESSWVCAPDGEACCGSGNAGVTGDCEVASELGSCAGERVCDGDGWTGCDAPAPAMELCNGADDDCDGLVDEGFTDLDGDGLPNCQPDTDGDGIPDADDGCPDDPDPDQADLDGDGAEDPCDPCPLDGDDDLDGDGICGDADVCPGVADPDQADADGDQVGDACDKCPLDPDNDADLDAWCADQDSCPQDFDPFQADADGDGLGDPCDPCPVSACEPCPQNPADADGDGFDDTCDPCPADPENDADGDGLCADADLCAQVADPNQLDSDGDGAGDACDPCPLDGDDDLDGDGHCADVDLCPDLADPGQEDSDSDGDGDPCDPCPLDPDNDADDDGVCGQIDLCPATADPDQADSDQDGAGDPCDPCPWDPADDSDGDGYCADVDVCPEDADADQVDSDGDGAGDPCDACPLDPQDDADGDGLCGDVDLCPDTAVPSWVDSDQDGAGDECDPCPLNPWDDPDSDGQCGFDPCSLEADPDADGDGVPDPLDPCPNGVPDPSGDPLCAAGFLAGDLGLGLGGDKEGGQAWADFDGDGFPDLVATSRENGETRVLFSPGEAGGDFLDVTATHATGLADHKLDRTALAADLNHDGFVDFLCNGSTRVEVYLNGGPDASPPFSFGDADHQPSVALVPNDLPGMNLEGIALADYDNDGWLDLLADNQGGIRVLRNPADGTAAFVDMDSLAIGFDVDASVGDFVAVADVDADGFVDFLDRKHPGPDLWMNNGDGTFTAHPGVDLTTKNGNKGGAVFCDLDSDGRFDLFWTDHGTDKLNSGGGANQIYRQTESGDFVPTGVPAEVTGNIDDAACGDFDHDGDLDLFLTSDVEDQLFVNEAPPCGPMAFELADLGVTGAPDGESAVFVDLDRDGDLDIHVIQDGANAAWINQANDDRYLVVQVRADLGGGASRIDVGATLRLLDANGKPVSGIREVSGGRGHGAQNPPWVHFGLPAGPSLEYTVQVVFQHGSQAGAVVSVVPDTLGPFHELVIPSD